MENSNLIWLSNNMELAMKYWFLLGILSLIVSIIFIFREQRQLHKLHEIGLRAYGSDYLGKVELRRDIVNWVDKYAGKNLKRWVYTANNTSYAGGMTDASALTDSIWSQEKERFALFRFLSRYSIMLGLLFTSAGLCITLASIAPALQTSGLEPNDWIKVVQGAMGKALGGMSTAFYSSLYGIGIGLILNILGLLILFPYHEKHLKEIDLFVQGTLVPIFTSIVEKDRNDVIIEVMERTDQSFEAVRKQYEEALNSTVQQAEDLKEMKIETKELAYSLSENTKALSEQIINLKESTSSMMNFTEPIANAIKEGLEILEKAQIKSTNQFEEIQNKLIGPFTQAIWEQFKSQQAETNKVMEHIENVSTEIKELNKQMSGSLAQITSDFKEQVKITSESTKITVEKVVTIEEEFRTASKQQYQNVIDQTNSLKQIAEAQGNLTTTLRNGIDSITLNKEAQEKKIAELYDLHRQAVENLYSQIGSRLGEIIESVTHQGLTDVGTYLSSGVESSIKITHEKLSGIHELFSILAEAHNKSALSIQSLEKIIRANENELKNDLEMRRQIVDELLSDAVGKTGKSLEQSFENSIKKMNIHIEHMLDNSLKRQENIVIELNEVLSKKWDNLMTAATATIS